MVFGGALGSLRGRPRRRGVGFVSAAGVVGVEVASRLIVVVTGDNVEAFGVALVNDEVDIFFCLRYMLEI